MDIRVGKKTPGPVRGLNPSDQSGQHYRQHIKDAGLSRTIDTHKDIQSLIKFNFQINEVSKIMNPKPLDFHLTPSNSGGPEYIQLTGFRGQGAGTPYFEPRTLTTDNCGSAALV